MRTAYMISKGEYSDYSVVAVCKDRSTAERVCQTLNDGREYPWDDHQIETVTMYEEEDIPQKIRIFKAEADLSRGPDYARRTWNYEVWSHEADTDEIACSSRPHVHTYHSYVRVSGTDEQAVNKCLTDRIAKFIAGAWDPREK